MTEETRPLLSILMAAYNCADSVVSSVMSALSERDVPLEVIVVDDASTDSTPRVLDWLASYDRRVKVVHRTENGGEGPCRASGMGEVTGEWLLMLDSDDLIIAGSLSALAPHLRETEADVVLSGHIRYDISSQVAYGVTPQVKSRPYPKGACFDPLEYKDALFSKTGSGIANKVFRMEHIRKQGVFFQDIESYGDIHFTLGGLATARRVEFVDIPHYHYRVGRSDSLTMTGSRFPTNMARACYGLQDYLVSKGLWDTWRIGVLNWIVALLPYTLSVMESYEGCLQLASEFAERGFDRLEFASMLPEQCIHPKRYEICRSIYEDGPGRGIYMLMRLNKNDFEAKAMSTRASQQTVTKLRSEIKSKNERITSLEEQVRELDEDLRAVWGSTSMRIGRAITSVPRTLRDLVHRTPRTDERVEPETVVEHGAAEDLPVDAGHKPLASFIVPIRKTAPYLKSCLESIAKQDCPSFEVLMADLGMGDKERSIAKDLARTDKRFVLVDVSEEEMGRGIAGLMAQADGDWLCLVCPADYLYPEFLGTAVGLAVGAKASIGTCATSLFQKTPVVRRMQAFDGIAVWTGRDYLAAGQEDGHTRRMMAWGKVIQRDMLGVVAAEPLTEEGSDVLCASLLESCDTLVESGTILYAHRKG